MLLKLEGSIILRCQISDWSLEKLQITISEILLSVVSDAKINCYMKILDRKFQKWTI